MTGKIGHNRNAIAPLRTLPETRSGSRPIALAVFANKTMSGFRKKSEHSEQCVNYTFKQEE
jgi:hypothetical protein